MNGTETFNFNTNINNIREKALFDRKAFASSIIISSLVLIRDIGIVPFPPFFYVIIVSLFCFVLPFKSLRSFSFFYIVGGSGLHGITYIPILIALMIRSKSINKYQVLFPIILLIFEIVHFATYSFEIDLNKYFVFGLVVTFFFFLLFDDNIDNDDVYNDMRFFILGITITLFIIMLHSIVSLGIEETLLGYNRLGTGFDEDEFGGEIGTSFNSNYIAYYSIIAIAMVLFFENLINNVWTKSLVMIINILAGIMSSSRTWFLLLLLSLIAYFLINRSKNKMKIMIVFLFLFILALRYNNISNAFITRFKNRFEEENVETAGMRTIVFAKYNQFLKEHPVRIVFGTGSIYYNRVCKIKGSIHNGTQQLIVCYGLLGVILFIWSGIVFSRRYFKKNNTRFISCIPLFVCVCFLQSIQFINPPNLMLPLIALLLPFKYKP